jgi:penicillin-binding protein 2
MNNKNPFLVTEDIKSGQKSSHQWVEGSSPVGLFSSERSRYLSLAISKGKLKLLLLFMVLMVMILLGRSFYLQVIRGDHYLGLADGNRLRIKYVKSHRGIIYDRNEELLVKNIFGFSLLITPADLPDDLREKTAVISKVVETLNLDKKIVEDQIAMASQYYFQPIVIETGIEYEQAMKLKIDSAKLPGVSLEIDSWRNYLAGDSLSHLLGYVGKINADEYERLADEYLLSDNIGKVGLEKQYEKCLKGEHGKKRVEVDVLGVEKKVVSHLPFVPGCDLVLTIDSNLQNKVYDVLEKSLGNSKAAAVIISNPQNGEILSLVDYPAYDNNLFAVGISSKEYNKLLEDKRKPLFIRSLLGEYPPGSTIKPIVAVAALEEGIITPQKSFSSVGGLWVADMWFFPDWKAGGHGVTNLYKAISESVNTYFYYIGGGYNDFTGLGVEKIVEYLKSFGLSGKTDIDLPSEGDGLVPSRSWKQEAKGEEWYIGDTYHLAIGQGDLLVTPMQVNSYNMTIANGGTIYQPHLVKEIIYPDGVGEVTMPTVLKKDFVSPENVQAVRRGMRQAVTRGSAVYLFDLPVEAAGKTGTAQWHNTKDNHAWFNAFAPYDYPTFAITVLVEEGGDGSKVAVPIAKEIMQYWFSK